MMTIALRLDPETRHKLELLAEATGYSRATLVAEAVRRFVDTELALLMTLQDQTEGATPSMDEAKEESQGPIERWNLIV